jgi:hypothetical protein
MRIWVIALLLAAGCAHRSASRPYDAAAEEREDQQRVEQEERTIYRAEQRRRQRIEGPTRRERIGAALRDASGANKPTVRTSCHQLYGGDVECESR